MITSIDEPSIRLLIREEIEAIACRVVETSGFSTPELAHCFVRLLAALERECGQPAKVSRKVGGA